MFDSDELKAKRYKAGEAMREGDDVKCKAERSASEQSGDSSPRSLRANSKPPEPPKQDYIHVRARRGQATDSHSLAERVSLAKLELCFSSFMLQGKVLIEFSVLCYLFVGNVSYDPKLGSTQFEELQI